MIIYLYHKRHKITGLNYFGKTKRNPHDYLGSGLHWIRHLNKHGKDIETISVWSFDDLDKCSKFAIDFSIKNNIVSSKEWANMKIENGLDGGWDKLSKESIKKGVNTRKTNGSYSRNNSAQAKRKDTMISKYGKMTTFANHTQETKNKLSKLAADRKHTEDTKEKMSESRRGSKNAFSKLNEIQASEIKLSNKSTLELASLYGVSRSLIYKIKDGSTWGHI